MKDSFMTPARAPDVLMSTEQVSSGSNLAMILSALLIAVTLMGIMAFCVWMCGCGAEDVIRGRSGSRSNKSSSTGMSSEEIEKLIPKMSYAVVRAEKKNADVGCCSVCLSEFTKEDHCIRVLPKCGHCFHTDCISMWLFSHTSCPVCRAVLVGNSSQKPCSNCQRVSNSSSSSSQTVHTNAIDADETVHTNADEVVIDVDERDTSASTSDR